MAFVKKFLEGAPNNLQTFLNSDFLKNADQINKGINALKPIDPNLSQEQQKQQNMKNVLAGTLGSMAINFLPKLAGFKQGGQAVKQKVKLMPVLDEPVYMNLGGVATKKQMAHNNQLFKLGGDVKGKLDKIALKQDTIPALLQVGEIVIPRRISTTKKFKNHLKKNYKYNPKKGKFNV
jgi:hypothetical protein